MLWRSLPNGDKFAPRRGSAPPPPEGYCTDSKNPYLAHPILPDCEDRFMSKETLSCGKVIGIIECSYFNTEVTQMRCFTCEVPNAKKVDSESNPEARSLDTDGEEKGDDPEPILLTEVAFDTCEEEVTAPENPGRV